MRAPNLNMKPKPQMIFIPKPMINALRALSLVAVIWLLLVMYDLCTYDSWLVNNHPVLRQLHRGMSKGQVISLLGKPNRVLSEQRREYWLYYFQPILGVGWHGTIQVRFSQQKVAYYQGGNA